MSDSQEHAESTPDGPSSPNSEESESLHPTDAFVLFYGLVAGTALLSHWINQPPRAIGWSDVLFMWPLMAGMMTFGWFIPYAEIARRNKWLKRLGRREFNDGEAKFEIWVKRVFGIGLILVATWIVYAELGIEAQQQLSRSR